VAAERLRHHTFEDAEAVAELTDPNLTAAFDVAVSDGDAPLALALAVWGAGAAIRTGILTPAIERLERTLALGPVPDDLRADALNALVSTRSNRGDADLAPLAAAAVDAARASGDARTMTRTLVTLANHVEPERAIALHEEAAELADSIGYHWMSGTARMNLGHRRLDLGQIEGALAAYEQAGVAYRAAESPMGIITSLNAIGDARLMLGDERGAAAAYEEALPTLRASAPPQFATVALTGLGVIAFRAGDRLAALGYAGDAASILGESEHFDTTTDVATLAAIVLADRHPAEAARGLAFIDPRNLLDAYEPDLARARATVERALGTKAVALLQASARRAGVRALAADVVRIAAAEGPAARRRIRARYEAFTKREEEVLRLLADGRSDGEIAATLGTSPKTASVHVANIKGKLGFPRRVEAALAARRLLDEVQGDPT
jgi:DNA-binding CsgD family transcriptional regulator/tetratricopeptide (TPR) repeat protein